MAPPRIAIATTGRFYVLDLARELHTLGLNVRFYSYVPRGRALRYGLPEACHVNLFPYFVPLLAMEKALTRIRRRWITKAIAIYADRLLMQVLKPCEVLIAMSGFYTSSLHYARQAHGSRVYVERASRHILSQANILRAVPGAEAPSDFDIRRELADYRRADKVVVPSKHVVESFTERGFPQRRLFLNHFGVDVSRFRPPLQDAGAKRNSPTAIFVGNWSLRKGADVVVQALKIAPDIRLVHVGPIGDHRFPSGPQFVHYEAVDQMGLPDFYHNADYFILPSREEGLSLVQAQALGCGLPIVCTNRTGGADLRQFIDVPEAVIVVPADDPVGLVNGMRSAFELSQRVRGIDLLGASGRSYLSWAAYGKRYNAELQNELQVLGSHRHS